MAVLLMLFLLLSPFAGTAGDQAPESNRIKTLRSLAKVDDFPLFKMRFYGDYALPGYAAGSGSPRDVRNGNPASLSPPWACTCFSTFDGKGGRLLGRNFDWLDHPALLLYTDLPGRPASVSLVDISYLGYAKNDSPDKNPGGLLQSPLLPFDGMNEHGLAVGMMAVPAAQPTRDPRKKTVGGLMAIRLMLDYAKNVEEALSALSLLKVVSQPNTIWSVVYDTRSLDFLVVMGRNYGRIHEFNLKRPALSRL